MEAMGGPYPGGEGKPSQEDRQEDLMKTIYALWQPGDVEGRTSYVVGHFTDKAVAEAIGATNFGSHAMGGSHGRVKEVKLFESAEDFYKANERADPTQYRGPGTINAVELLRERAMAKLSEPEKRALGLLD